MKTKFVITFLVLVSILSITIGQTFLPLWGWITVLVISTGLLVSYLVNASKDHEVAVRARNKELDEFLSRTVSNVNIQLECMKSEIMDSLSVGRENIVKVIQDNSSSLLDNIASRSKDIDNQLTGLEKLIEKDNTGLTGRLCDLSDLVHSSTNEITSKIKLTSDSLVNESRRITDAVDKHNASAEKQIFKSVEILREAIAAQSESLKENSKLYADTLDAATAEHSAAIQQKLEDMVQQTAAVQAKITASVADLSAKADSVAFTVKETDGGIRERLNAGEEKITDALTTGIAGAISTLSGSVDNLMQSSNTSAELLLQTSKEHNAVIQQKLEDMVQQTAAVQNSIATSTTDLSTKSDGIALAVKQSDDSILEKLNAGEEKITDALTTGIAEAISTLSGSVEGLKQSSDTSAELLLQTSKEHNAAIQQKLEGMAQQTAVVQNLIATSTADFSAKNDDIALAVKQSHEGIRSQYDSVNRNLASVLIKSQNIEKTLAALNIEDSKKDIIKSFNSVITELKTELKNSVSDVNGNILDAQILQENTVNELAKLQILLRSVIKSFEENNSRMAQQSPRIDKAANTQQATHSAGLLKKDTPKPVSIYSQPQPQLNRTETIVDSETQNIVTNQFKDGHLVKSTMNDQKGHLIYEVEYVSGHIARSKNYDAKGNLNLEQIFYDNEQVHYRNEYNKGIKKTTEFDLNGKRKK